MPPNAIIPQLGEFMSTPEELARQDIDKQLEACGWIVQPRRSLNLYAGRGVAVREFALDTGEADCLLFVDCKAVGLVEARLPGTRSVCQPTSPTSRCDCPSYMKALVQRPSPAAAATPSPARLGYSTSIVLGRWLIGCWKGIPCAPCPRVRRPSQLASGVCRSKPRSGQGWHAPSG